MSGRPKVAGKQYTIRKVPAQIDLALRHYAQSHGKSVNDAAIDILAAGLGRGDKKVEFHDLDFIAGSWKEDPAFHAAIKAQDQVDPAMWR